MKVVMQFECGTRILRVISRARRPCHLFKLHHYRNEDGLVRCEIDGSSHTNAENDHYKSKHNSGNQKRKGNFKIPLFFHH